MKKYMNLAFIVLLACNNQNGTATTDSPAVATAAVTATPPGGNCGNLVLFRKGAVLEGATYDATGKEIAKQKTTITDVKQEGGIMIANAKIETSSQYSKGNEKSLTYKCDGTNLYMDLQELMQSYAAMKGTEVKANTMQFPLTISAGQTLPEASVSVSMDRGTGKKMDMVMHYRERTVGAKEKITTPAGSWNCYKVNTTMESEMVGMDEKTKKIMESMKDKMKMRMVMWYAPDFGIVKTDMYMGDKLQSHSQINSVKY
jgi:hypothetical protein